MGAVAPVGAVALPVSLPRAGRRSARRPWEVLCWSGCAVFALLLCLRTTIAPHQVWGACAAAGYGLAALVAHFSARPWGRASAAVAAVGSVLVPLVFLVADGARQMEVTVVERSGSLLLDSGSPYVPDPAELRDYNPYLPGMALFGLPHATLGDVPLADARLWFALVSLGAMGLAALVSGGSRPAGPGSPLPRTVSRPARRGASRSLLWLAATPAVALPLAVGGVDLPVIALMCLALALAGRGRAVAAGLALGAAAALKWTAWPLLPVGLALLAVTAGRRAAVRAGAAAVALAVLAVLPAVLAGPGAFAEHVLLFPLGEGGTGSPATSPLPGHLLATYVPGGFALAVAALALSAVAMAVSLVTRPPRTTVAAADRLALGLGIAMCLIPATRFGYVVYPLVLFGWFRLVPAGRRPARPGAAMPTRLMPTRLMPARLMPARLVPRRFMPTRTTPSRTTPSPETGRPLRWTYSALCALSRRFSFVEDEIDGLRHVVRDGDVCLDIGAEYGVYTYALSYVAGPKGCVHGFEPLPGPYRVLGAGVRLLCGGRAHAHRLALGDRPRDAAVMSLPYRRGLPVHGRAFLTDGARGLGPNEEFAGERRPVVRVGTVDEVVAAAGLPRVDFVKADVEGAEPLVLAGAAGTLLRDRPTLLLEIEERHLAKYGARAGRLVGELLDAGYSMFRWREGRWCRVDRVTGAHRNYLFTVKPLED
ncbi:FkbM family methyltransferase [Streptomyces sp. NPDC050546]|uniref:FkbM family methyltransferase n=1 Tax=Streptomyces sp. NPDC050546 TaxID=3365628 RepID=UPI0037999636